MKNFQVEDKDTGQKYWISRAIAVCGIVIVKMKDGTHSILINKRGSSAPNYKGCWNLICGYLDWDETLVQAISREVLEETKVAIPTCLWENVGIADDPTKDGLQNVTIRFRTYINESEFNEFNQIGSKMIGKDGGERDEVDAVWLMPLDEKHINSVEWAFNHKDLTYNEMLSFNNQ